MGWGGLRGAVGIALALSLNSEVNHYTEASDVNEQTRRQFQDYTAKLFGFVGGIAFLTLIINGISSGPLLHKLGLVTPTETRKKVLENYRQRKTRLLCFPPLLFRFSYHRTFAWTQPLLHSRYDKSCCRRVCRTSCR